MRLARPLSAASLAVALGITLAACSQDEAPAPAPTTTAPSATPAAEDDAPSATPEATDAPEAPETSSAPAPEESQAAQGEPGELVTADFARPVTTPGEKLTTVDGPGFTVDIYQVGVTKATRDGLFVDGETKEPIIAEGDDIVFVNYVVTNTGTETIPLSNLYVQVSGEYADWKYLGGMDSISDSSLFEKFDVNTDAYLIGYDGEAPFEWKPGTSFSYGENFKYQKGSDINFTVELTPSTPDGELDHDASIDDIVVSTKIS